MRLFQLHLFGFQYYLQAFPIRRWLCQLKWQKLGQLQLAAHRAGWIKVITLNENRGAASTQNAGWEAASQSYIVFLDADDA